MEVKEQCVGGSWFFHFLTWSPEIQLGLPALAATVFAL